MKTQNLLGLDTAPSGTPTHHTVTTSNAAAASKTRSNEPALIQAVKEHAKAHYDDGGWDVIVECWEDKDIARTIKGARTAAGAIKKVAEIVAVFADRQADAENSAW